MRYLSARVTLSASLFFLFSLVATAQTYTGKVVKTDGTAMESATVILQNEVGGMLKFSKTNKQGQFAITTPEGKKAATLTFVSVGFNKKTLSLNDYKNGQATTMEERTEELREVEVKPDKFWVKGDTLVFSVLGYREKQDRSIEDVLKRLPGINVGKDGAISYNGKNINKFYVEGEDLTDGKYAQITKNLSADKVKNVEVLQNHQPVKLLRGKQFSEQAAINLVLNNDAKGSLTGTADFTTGLTLQHPNQWLRDSRLVAMMFGNGMQTLNMYKCNNTGDDVVQEIISHYFRFQEERIILNNIHTGWVPVGDIRRSRFNDSHLVASNWLFKTSKESNLRVQLSGVFDRSKGERYRITQYADVSTPTVVEENATSTTYTREWNAGINYTLNSSKLHLENRLNGQANFNESSAITHLNGRLIHQHVEPRKRSVSEVLMLTKNIFKNSIIRLNSFLDYIYMPGRLLLHYGAEEDLNVHALNWNTNMELTHKLGNVSIGGQMTFELSNKHEHVAYADTIQSIGFNRVLMRLSPTIAYNALKGERILDFRFLPRFSRLHRTMGNEQEDRWICEPQVSISYLPSFRYNFSVHYNYRYSPNDFYVASPLRVYTTYNMATSGTGIFDHGSSHSGNASFTYRDAKGKSSTIISYYFTRSKSGQLYNSRLEDGIYVREAVGGRNVSQSHSVRLNSNRSFGWLNSKIGLTGSYEWNKIDVLLSGKPTAIKGNVYSIGETFSLHPILWMTVSQASSFNASCNKNAAFYQHYTRFFNHRLDLTLTPGKWQMEWKNECYHSNDKDMKFSFFSDLSVSYRTKAYELGVFCYNLLGRNRYEHRFVTAESMNYYIYRLRPRELLFKLCLSL